MRCRIPRPRCWRAEDFPLYKLFAKLLGPLKTSSPLSKKETTRDVTDRSIIWGSDDDSGKLGLLLSR